MSRRKDERISVSPVNFLSAYCFPKMQEFNNINKLMPLQC